MTALTADDLLASAVDLLQQRGDLPLLAITAHWQEHHPEAAGEYDLLLPVDPSASEVVLAVGLSEVALDAVILLRAQQRTEPLDTLGQALLVHGYDGSPMLDLPYWEPGAKGEVWASILVHQKP